VFPLAGNAERFAAGRKNVDARAPGQQARAEGSDSLNDVFAVVDDEQQVRLLGTGRSDKNDPYDARSVAIAALRAPELVSVRVEDHASVLGLLARRHTQLAWTYNKTACRLHALAAELVPGGISQEIVVCQARSLLEQHQPTGAVAVERHLLAVDLVDELDRLGTQRKALRKRINLAVAASGTTLVDIFGIGDVIAAVIVGQVDDIARFRTADRFAAYNGTAPIEWSSGNPKRPVHRLSRRGNRTLNHAIHIAAVTQLRHRHSPGRGYYDRKRARALPAARRCGRSSAGSAMLSTGTSSLTPLDAADRPGRAVQETTPQACVTGPNVLTAGASAQAAPGPAVDPTPTTALRRRPHLPRPCTAAQTLDEQRGIARCPVVWAL
jgi:transposase